ncbi:MAG TPA: hypothetical protein VNE58_13545, partial [Casimicrobiaceae bacterium]|nr:hypothetical protein [Casimicrobiaceae bacterium]
GRSLRDIELAGVVEVTGVRRRGSPSQRPDDDFRFEIGDVVVLLGRPQELAIAERKLLEG